MFADPTSITINAVAESFAAISRTENRSVYATADGEFRLEISRSNGTRNRHLVKLTHTKVATNPVDSTDAEVSMSVHMVIDTPKWGFAAADADNIVDGLASFCTNPNVAKLLAGET